MRLPHRGRNPVGLWLAAITLCPGVYSQDIAPGSGRTPAAQPSDRITIDQLVVRLRAMEESNQRLADELAKAKREHADQLRQIFERLERQPGPGDVRDERAERPLGDAADPPSSPEEARVESSDTPVPDYTEGQFSTIKPAPGYPAAKETGRGRLPLNGSFGPGFQFQTPNEEFRLRMHYESQIEGRVWGQQDQVPANSGIFLPRQRIFFSGNITKPVEYGLAINRGFGTFNILNAFINIHFDDRLELRFGRFFTPFNYDQYAISNYWLPTPERSIFTTNVGLNRQFGLMAWGYLLDKKLDYAAGIFNGSRNSFEALSNGLDFVTYLNARPFQDTDSLGFLRFLNVGTSFAVGDQNQAAVPVSFRIAGGSPNGDNPGPGTVPFLIFDRGVVERGDRLLGSVHSAYYYKGLSLIGEWQYGHGSYASASHPSSRVPFSGFYVSGGYLLTGEQVERRTRVTPLRPLIPLRKGDARGAGAWEVAGRVSQLRLGEEVFAAGFADPGLWSNRATTTELGLNWYWNDYIKIYMFWLHGEFGSPVQYRPGGLQTSSDLFWLRACLEKSS